MQSLKLRVINGSWLSCRFYFPRSCGKYICIKVCNALLKVVVAICFSSFNQSLLSTMIEIFSFLNERVCLESIKQTNIKPMI